MYNKCFIYFHCSVFWRASGWSQGEVLSVHCKCIISAGCWCPLPAKVLMPRINLVSISHLGSMSPSPDQPAQPSPAVWAASHLLQPGIGITATCRASSDSCRYDRVAAWGHIHVQGVLKPAIFGSFPRAYMMCNWAQIFICGRLTHWP